MKLQKFVKSSTKKKKALIACVIVACLLVAGFALLKTYAFYQEEKTYNVLKGAVPDFVNASGDVSIAVLVNGEKQSTFPSGANVDGYHYAVTDVSCTKDATGSWDSIAWNLTVSNLGQTNTVCTVSFTKTERYAETILNGADPVLADNLIPVTIANDGTVKKANVASEWYNYGNKVWANAVILSDKSVSYADNETIPESNIESYFVWIPKYSYQIWDLGTYTGLTSLTTKNQTINIKFGTTNTSDSVSGECTTPGTSGGSGNCAVGEYMTPPAFTTMGTNGIWVGKFETGYKGSGSTSAAQVNASDSTKVQIKPNVYSWRNITVGNIFTTAYNYQRTMDSHMMKNTEWAVAAMLSHTKYGKGTEVWINNNSNFVTGCVGASASAGQVSGCTNTYNSTNGYQGSSTGNISGIYDMSGGAWEYMAGYISGNTGSAGITPSNYNAKYFDVYSSSSAASTYQYRILGDLTGELGPFQDSSGYRSSWYSDYAYFVVSTHPWFTRSGAYVNGAYAGAFYFNRWSGVASTGAGFRVVLAV